MPFVFMIGNLRFGAGAPFAVRDKPEFQQRYRIFLALLQYRECNIAVSDASSKSIRCRPRINLDVGNTAMTDDRLATYGAFLLRVTLGVMFISHAYLKLAVFTVPGFESYLQHSGLPSALAWPIILAELAGGIAILTGFYTRLVSLALLPLLLGA